MSCTISLSILISSLVEVQSRWGDPVVTLDFLALQTNRVTAIPANEILTTCGKLEKFNSAYSRLTARMEKVRFPFPARLV